MWNKRPVFYMAHTFGERYYVRDTLIPKLESIGFKMINPFYEENGEWKEGQIDLKIKEEDGILLPDMPDLFKEEKPKEIGNIGALIVSTDLNTIFFKCDGIIAYMPDSSAGTISEIWSQGFINWYVQQKNNNFIFPDITLQKLADRPVFLLTKSDRNFNHVWLRYACREIFKNEEEMLEYLEREIPSLVREVNARRPRY